MRIVSLLPSATEILYVLGAGPDVVGVTHECDWPPAVAGTPKVSRSVLPAGLAPAEVDRLVSASLAGGEPIYRLDAGMVRALAPDLVVTQDVCAVCAVPSGHVQEALSLLGSPATVLSLDPGSLTGVLDCVLAVGDAVGRRARAEAVVESLAGRLAAVRAAVAGRPRPRVFALEWGDPPFNGGHWVPEMIEAAGGTCLLAQAGAPSVRLGWEAIAEADPDVVVFMPCGYDLAAAVAEGETLARRPEFAALQAFYAADGSAYFSRPGPRLLDGVEALASVLHPGCGVAAPAGAIRRISAGPGSAAGPPRC